MKIVRKSAITGIERTRDIPVDPEHYTLWEQNYVGIEQIMPYLSEEDREFILSGIVPGEWQGIMARDIFETYEA